MTDDLWWPPNPIQSCKASAEWTKQASEAWWAIKDKSGQKDENTERQKDNTQDSEGFHPNANELRSINMNKYEFKIY